MSNIGNEIGGNALHIKDCYIWSEIYYLDSATDYREYLPQHHVTPRAVPEDDLIMLDSLKRPTSRWRFWGSSFLVVSLLICYFLWYDLHYL
jgi:hypothetical protein